MLDKGFIKKIRQALTPRPHRRAYWRTLLGQGPWYVIKTAVLWPFRVVYFVYWWYMRWLPYLRAEIVAMGGWGKTDDAYQTEEFGAEWWGCDLTKREGSNEWDRGPALTPADWRVR